MLMSYELHEEHVQVRVAGRALKTARPASEPAFSRHGVFYPQLQYRYQRQALNERS